MKSKLSRQIGVQTRSIAGHFFSYKNRRSLVFESTLERDHFYILEFDNTVTSFIEQPIAIESNFSGQKIKYFPDCLVHYDRGVSQLIEIKYSYDLEDPLKKEKLKRKFEVLDEYAKQHDLVFKVITEKEIRNTRLQNYTFLYRYLEQPQSFKVYETTIINFIKSQRITTANDILNHICCTNEEKGFILPSIWHLIACGQIYSNPDVKLSNLTQLEAL